MSSGCDTCTDSRERRTRWGSRLALHALVFQRGNGTLQAVSTCLLNVEVFLAPHGFFVHNTAYMVGFLSAITASSLYLGSLVLRIWTMTAWYRMQVAEKRLLDVRLACSCAIFAVFSRSF